MPVAPMWPSRVAAQKIREPQTSSVAAARSANEASASTAGRVAAVQHPLIGHALAVTP
jgi:hypothetical protein